AVHVEIARSGDLAASEQEDLLVAGDQSRHDRARLDDAAAGRSLADLGCLQQLLARADARFLFALLILGRVVAAGLLEVALFACSFDACGDLVTADGREVLELFGEAVVGLLREERYLSVCGHSVLLRCGPLQGLGMRRERLLLSPGICQDA